MPTVKVKPKDVILPDHKNALNDACKALYATLKEKFENYSPLLP